MWPWDNNPAETTVYAYVNSNSDINRYQGEDGLFYVDIDVTLANGENGYLHYCRHRTADE